MNKMVSKLALLLAVLILCGFVFSVAADTATNQQTVMLQECFDTASALAYGVVPENLYPFIYPGSNPYPWVEIDTTNCIVGEIYVYNSDTNILTHIGSDAAKTYAAAADYFYYVTTDNTIKKSDYIGASITTLYTSSLGSIHNLSVFGNILYFVEAGKQLIFLDTVSGNTQQVLTEDDLVSVFVFNADKLVWYDSKEQAWYYNLSTGRSVALQSHYEENALIAQYTTSDTENSVISYQLGGQGDSYNDIAFPLPLYPATLGVEEYDSLEADSHFNRNYAGSNECDGFAKYAHDSFWHILIDNRTQPSWMVNGVRTDDVYGNVVMNTDSDRALVWREKDYYVAIADGSYVDNTAVVTQFFRQLDRGSFVRYGKGDDATKWDGSHSIVFDGLSDDGAGIIVYEANQDWENGVGYQKYYFSTIHRGYEWILYYVEHDIGDNNACENIDTHKVCCANCNGYLRQSHTYDFIDFAQYSEEQHTVSFGCCDGETLEDHDFGGEMIYESELEHIVFCIYCNELEWQVHPTEQIYYYPMDTKQHSIFYECCGEVVMENHNVQNGRCIDCGM